MEDFSNVLWPSNNTWTLNFSRRYEKSWDGFLIGYDLFWMPNSKFKFRIGSNLSSSHSKSRLCFKRQKSWWYIVMDEPPSLCCHLRPINNTFEVSKAMVYSWIPTCTTKETLDSFWSQYEIIDLNETSRNKSSFLQYLPLFWPVR